ncbi:MAG TPA: hypothetical protein VNW15_09210 [Rhizomicrobium sp.]|nr:hypothetical protein [Rhizomicrobium sp.]
MLGNLNQPPIIVRSSRTKVVWAFLASVCIAAIGILDFLSAQTPPPTSVLFVTTLCVFGSAYYAWKLARPDTLELSPHGLICKTRLSNRKFGWSEINLFQVITHRAKGLPWYTVAFYCNPDDPDKIYRVDLGNQWEIANADLCNLLDQARAKWNGAG